MARIAVIEDEATIADAVAARLRTEGFEVDVAHDGPSGVDLVERTQPDLVVLDVMLPGFDGIEVCRRIQAARAVPVVMLTARGEETDVLVGLGVGADDYVTKPFSPRELVARIRAVLRRTERAASDANELRRTERAASDANELRLGEVVVNPARRRVYRAGDEVHLTATEFDLLTHLAGRPGTVFTREQLLSAVWGYGSGFGARSVDSHVAALRRKLGAAVVRTVHGVGYAVEAP